MSYLNQMYGRKSQDQTQSSSNKNPNRVLGGLRGQGADMMTVLGEDGTQHTIPSQKYVQGLEEKIRTQDARLTRLEQQLRRVNRDTKMD
jgi:hypothetical protein